MDASFFAGNRRRLRESLQPNSFIVLAGFGAMQRDVDQPFAFQQEGNFWYVTGIEEADWQIVIDVDSGHEWLVQPTLSNYQQIFDGGLHANAAAKISGVEQVISRSEAKKVIANLLAKKQNAYTLLPQTQRAYGFQPNNAHRHVKNYLKGSKAQDIRLPLAKLRAIKQPAELTALQSAIDVTIDGIMATLKQVKNYTHEHQVDASLYYEFRSRGAVHGFDPIVASGHKTCILHAPAANDPLKEWLLLDVGARVHGYSADITRTIPLQKPTERQVLVYQAVQRAHDSFLKLLKPGAITKDVMQQAYTAIGQEMLQLGLIKSVKLTPQSVFKFMPHGITHGLGVDVHDPLGRPETLQENMVLTDEVGIYIPDESFGVRIENDIVITTDGARNMSARLPITLDALTKMLY